MDKNKTRKISNEDGTIVLIREGKDPKEFPVEKGIKMRRENNNHE